MSFVYKIQNIVNNKSYIGWTSKTVDFRWNEHKKDALKFGNSIHYCNMHVNGEKINDYISKLSPNIIGLGAPFVDQIEPGPISNDIMNDAILKLRLLNINEE